MLVEKTTAFITGALSITLIEFIHWFPVPKLETIAYTGEIVKIGMQIFLGYVSYRIMTKKKK